MDGPGDAAGRSGEPVPVPGRTRVRVARAHGGPPRVILQERGFDDVAGGRLVPPQVEAFLRDRRIDPVTRAFLRGLAAKPADDWTLADLQLLTSVVPTLTEMRIATATLSAFYEFLGLDPGSLFDPQLGNGWQSSSTAYDPRRFGMAPPECREFRRRGAASLDGTQVRLRELADCRQGDGRG